MEQLTHPENLYWAWNKVKNQYQFDGGWHNPIELAKFEANLENELKKIRSDLKKNDYKISSIEPLPYPKKNKDTGEHEARQLFWISIRDQVTWVAFVNIIGPFLDVKMPTWSYGHRLYRPVWIEEENREKIKKMGWYRHSSGNIYRKFKHSWPLYRRHVLLTIQRMSKNKYPLNYKEKQSEDLESTLDRQLQLIYLRKKYWQEKSFDNLYWASIDFKKFYPSIKHDAIKENIESFLDAFSDEKNRIIDLSAQLLKFPVDCSRWNKKEIAEIDLEQNEFFDGIPTGLFVAGFLSNIAMLKIDRKVNKIMESKKSLAHFRFVDDHIFIAPKFEELKDWFFEYEKIINNAAVGISINKEKTKPIEFMEYIDSKEKNLANDKKKSAEKKSKLDTRFPSPFITETLGQISNIARTNFDLLDHKEQRNLLDELEHLMLADFNDEEIRRDTRLSFAASRIAKFAPRLTRISDLEKQYDKDIKEIELKIAKLEKHKTKNNSELKELKRIHQSLKEYKSGYKNSGEKDSFYDKKLIYDLLLRAVREYPDKLRLWTKVLEFCMEMGEFDYKEIIKEIDILSNTENIASSLTCSYVSSFLKLLVSKHLLISIKTIIDDDESITKKNIAIEYLYSLLPFAHELHTKKNKQSVKRKNYEIVSDNLVRCAMGTIKHVLENNKLTGLSENKKKEILKKIWKITIRKINWENPAREWNQARRYLLTDWGWWVVNILNNPFDSVPGAVWRQVASQVNLAEDSSWSFLIQFPKYLPSNAIKLLLSNNRIRTDYFETQNLGWLYDIVSSSAAKKSKVLEKKIKSITPAVSPPNENSEYITLYEWAIWGKEKYIKDPYDPRVSEWTCLYIAEKCIKELQSIKENLLNEGPELKYIHPSNFELPKTWINDDNDEKHTWLSWKRKMDDDKSVEIKPRENRIGDKRITIHWEKIKGLESEFSPVFGMGMILLGLLRRSYDWPRTWNPSGLHRSWENLARRMIQLTNCSSHTQGILLACLLTRPRENFYFQKDLFKQPEIAEVEDTLIILPEIYDLDKLLRHIVIARDVLIKYQMSVHDNLPRQLIPIRLEAVTEKIWYEKIDDE
jgi:hypothetical protein